MIFAHRPSGMTSNTPSTRIIFPIIIGKFRPGNGIITHRSRGVMVRNSAFENIWPDAAYTSDHNGSAIASVGEINWQMAGGLSVQPASIQPTITNSSRGIYTNYSSLRASGIDMTAMRTGIYSTRCTDMLRSDVSGCSIEASWRGIDWRNNHGAFAMRANNNEIVIDNNQLGIAISLDEMNPGGGEANYEIKDNWRIDITSATGGIVARNVNRAIIENNNITQNSDGINYPQTGGIVVEFGKSNDIFCNTVISTDPAYPLSYGLFNRNSSNNIGCNSFRGQERGVHFGGNLCDGTVFTGNEMRDNYVGLYLNSNAIIGPQPIGGTPPFHGNRWIPSTFSSGFGAANINAGSQQILFQNLFTTRSIGSGGLIEHNPDIPGLAPNVFLVNNTGWFAPLPIGTTFDCGLSIVCNQQVVGGGGDDDLRLLIAYDSTLTSGYIPESKSMSRQLLYDALVNDSALLVSDSAFVYFMAAHQYGAVGQLHEVKRLYSNIGKLDSTDKATLLSVYETINQYSDSIYYLDSISRADTTLNFTQQILDFKALIEQQQVVSGTILHQLRMADSLYLAGAQTYNQNVVSGELPLQNERTVNEISRDYYNAGIDSIISSYNELLMIAGQCPYSGGEAVIRARVLLNMINDTLTFDDTQVCIDEGYYRLGQQVSTSKISTVISVVPNPASTQADVILQGYSTGVCYISVTDVMGKVQLHDQFECQKQTHTLNLSSLNPGIYIVTVSANNESSIFTKLIVVR